MTNENVAEVSCEKIITALRERTRADSGDIICSQDLQIMGGKSWKATDLGIRYSRLKGKTVSKRALEDRRGAYLELDQCQGLGK